MTLIESQFVWFLGENSQLKHNVILGLDPGIHSMMAPHNTFQSNPTKAFSQK